MATAFHLGKNTARPLYLIVNLQLFIRRFILKQRGSVYVGLGLHRIVIFQVETGYFQVRV